MSLFYEASKHVTYSVGSKSLHAVKELNSAERFKLFCIVKRKTSFWFWKDPKFIPTQVTLQDLILKKPKLPDASNTFTVIKNFVEKPTLKVDGKIGGKISSELNLDLSGSDSLDITIDLGDIVKTEVNWEILQQFLENNPIDYNHPLLEEVKRTNRTTLCIVLESLSTKADSKLEGDSVVKVETDDSIPVSKSVVTVNITAKGSYEKTLAHSFTIPAATVLSYGCNEFSIHENGVASLHPATASLDDSNKPLIDKSKSSDPVLHIRNEFQPLIKSDKYVQIQTQMKQLLADLRDDSFQQLHMLLSFAEKSLNYDHADNTIEARDVLSSSKNESLKEFLVSLGFMIPDDSAPTNARITFPKDDKDGLLPPCLGFIDACDDLSVEIRQAIAQISPPHMKVLLDIVEKQFHGSDVLKNDTTVRDMFSKDPSTETMLKNIGFIDMQADDEEFLIFPKEDKIVLTDVYTVLYVLSSGQ